MIGKQKQVKRILGLQNARQKYDEKTKKILVTTAGLVAIDPIIATPFGISGISRMLRSWANEKAVRKRLLHNPKAARLVAEKAAGTPYESYFKEIAEKAKAGRKKKRRMFVRAQSQKLKAIIKHRMFVRAQSQKVRAILEMQAALKKAEKEQAKRERAKRKKIRIRKQMRKGK